MAQSYAGTWKAQIQNNAYINALDLGNVEDALALLASVAFTNGTGANQANCLWHDQRTLSTASGENLDLTALTNAFGVATFTKVKAILIAAVTTDTGYTLQIGGDANSIPIFGAVADYIILGAGGVLLWIDPVDGRTVTGATGDILKVYNPSGGNFTYKVVVLGVGTVA